MSDRRRVADLRVGDVFEWAGRPVKLVGWKRVPRGRWLNCELPDGEMRELHYYEHESVVLAGERDA